jgi:BirA family transcriptional regulator, biotin operon repressor / biotin---[acetyl-CoA-carboxylase] ligase
MASIIVPSILDRIAAAGATGIAYPAADPDRRDLDMCHSMGLPLEIREGKVRLTFDRDSLVPSWIEAETPSLVWQSLGVKGFFETTSTNAEALLLARQGADEGTLIYAECQTAGRGRKGRQWISPAGAGIYFSLILRPHQPPDRWALLSQAASITLVRALRELAEAGFIPGALDLELKWPNDLLLSGKKAAGILAETAGAAGNPPAVVLGVGVNVNRTDLPGPLSNHAISISEAAGVRVARRHLLVRFLFHFQMVYERFQRGELAAILEEWKGYSRMWRDTPVWIIENEIARPGITAGLTESGALLVRTPHGTEEVILAGDVSVRQKNWEER